MHFTSVLKKLVGVTQLYVRGLVMDRDDSVGRGDADVAQAPLCRLWQASPAV